MWTDTETGRIRHMQGKPDFEVIAGKLAVQNIPGMKK